MAKKKKEKYSSNIEWFDRFCPVCDKKINKGEPSHHCKEEDLIIEEETEEEVPEETPVEETPPEEKKKNEAFDNFLNGIMRLW